VKVLAVKQILALLAVSLLAGGCGGVFDVEPVECQLQDGTCSYEPYDLCKAGHGIPNPIPPCVDASSSLVR